MVFSSSSVGIVVEKIIFGNTSTTDDCRLYTDKYIGSMNGTYFASVKSTSLKGDTRFTGKPEPGCELVIDSFVKFSIFSLFQIIK